MEKKKPAKGVVKIAAKIAAKSAVRRWGQSRGEPKPPPKPPNDQKTEAPKEAKTQYPVCKGCGERHRVAPPLNGVAEDVAEIITSAATSMMSVHCAGDCAKGCQEIAKDEFLIAQRCPEGMAMQRQWAAMCSRLEAANPETVAQAAAFLTDEPPSELRTTVRMEFLMIIYAYNRQIKRVRAAAGLGGSDVEMVN